MLCQLSSYLEFSSQPAFSCLFCPTLMSLSSYLCCSEMWRMRARLELRWPTTAFCGCFCRVQPPLLVLCVALSWGSAARRIYLWASTSVACQFELQFWVRCFCSRLERHRRKVMFCLQAAEVRLHWSLTLLIGHFTDPVWLLA